MTTDEAERIDAEQRAAEYDEALRVLAARVAVRDEFAAFAATLRDLAQLPEVTPADRRALMQAVDLAELWARRGVPQPSPRWLSVKDAAKILHVGLNTIYDWTHAGRVVCRRLAGGVLEVAAETLPLPGERLHRGNLHRVRTSGRDSDRARMSGADSVEPDRVAPIPAESDRVAAFPIVSG